MSVTPAAQAAMDEAVAKMDFKPGGDALPTLPAFSDLLSERNQAAAIQRQQEALTTDPDRGVMGMMSDAFKGEATWNLLNSDREAIDDAFTFERWKERMDSEVRNSDLPPEYHDFLTSAVSDKDFDKKLARARESADAAGRLERDGLSGMAAQIAAGIFDPVTLAAGGGLGKTLTVGRKIARLRHLRASNAAIGAVVGGASVGVKDYNAPRDVDPWEYAAAVGLGLSVGGLIGGASPVARASREAAGVPTARVRVPDDPKLPPEILPPKKTEAEIDAAIPRRPVEVREDFAQRMRIEVGDETPGEPVLPVGEEGLSPLHPEDFASKVKDLGDGLLREVDREIEALTPKPPKVVIGDKASREARFKSVDIPEPANGNEREFVDAVKRSLDDPEARVFPLEEPTPAPRLTPDEPAPATLDDVLADLSSGKRTIGQVVDDVVSGRGLTATNDANRGGAIKGAKLSPEEALRLAEDANTYKAPHRFEPPNVSRDFQLNWKVPAVVERDYLAITGPVVARLRAMGVDVRTFAPTGKKVPGGFATGEGRTVAINVMMRPQQARAVLEHEEIHALRRHKVIPDDIWKVLIDESKKVISPVTGKSIWWNATDNASSLSGSVKFYQRILRDPNDPRITQQAVVDELMNEEAVAQLIGNEGVIGAPGSPLYAFVEALKTGKLAEAYRAGRKDLPDDLRLVDATDDVPAHIQRNEPQPEELEMLRGAGFENIRPEDVPEAMRTLGLAPRLDIAGYLAKSRNHMTRILGDLFWNDSVGKAGHATNGIARETFRSRLIAKQQYKIAQVEPDAVREWAQENGMKVGLLNSANVHRQFQREVGRALRGLTPDDQISPAVRRVVTAHREVYADMLEYLKNPLRDFGQTGRSLPGAEYLSSNPNYTPRIFHQGNLNTAIRAHGFEPVRQVVKEAIRRATPEIDEGLLDRMSTGYLTRVHRAVNGVDDDLGWVIAQGDQDEMARVLSGMGLTDEEVGRVTAMFGQRGSTGSAGARLKPKTLLDEGATHEYVDANGVTRSLSFHDLLVHDADLLMENYLSRMSGRVAAAGAIYRNPATGETVLNGVVSDQEFRNLLRLVREQGERYIQEANGYSADDLAKEVEMLEFAWDRLLGRPLAAQQGRYADTLRLLRSTQYHKLADTGIFAQMAEMAMTFGGNGVRASVKHFPAIHRLFTRHVSKDYAETMFDELQAIGIGVEGQISMSRPHGIDDLIAGEAEATGRAGWMVRAGGVTGAINKATSTISRMPFITDAQQKMAAAAMAQRLFDMARKGVLPAADLKRLKQLGLNEDMIGRIMGQLSDPKIASIEDGLFGRKIKLLNFHAWTDREAAGVLMDAMHRSSRKMIQTRDIGMMSRWMLDPTWQTILQFKSFSFLAWPNHLLYQLGMRDTRAAMTAVTSMMMGSALYAAQTHIKAASRADRGEYLRDKLSAERLLAAGFQRSAVSSIVPMLYDTLVPRLTNTKKLFDTRTSGTSSDLIFGSPLAGSIENLSTGIAGAIAHLTGGRDMSQAEARSLLSIIPFANWAAVAPVINSSLQSLPARAPQAESIFESFE